MGLGRLFWRSTGFGRAVDTVKNVKEEGSVSEGIKKTVKEDWCEDNPITSVVYRSGKYDGKVEGYKEASDEYEEKLLKQAEEFLKQKQILESQRDAYEKLLDEYEKEIDNLEAKVNKSEEEKDCLYQLMRTEIKLLKLKS